MSQDDSDLVADLLALDTCAISDALDSMGLPPAVTGLSPLTVRAPVAGRAVTVKLGPNAPETGPPRHLATAAIESATTGNVIVIEHTSGIECAGWGGVLSAGAQIRGVAGVVIDGPARDIDEARELGFPVYGRSASARTARGRVFEEDFDCQVTIGDVVVHPGDYVLADGSGVAFVTPEHLEETLRRAKRIVARESLMVDALRRGDKITDVVGRDYETMLDTLGPD